jgi:hypothetical protein
LQRLFVERGVDALAHQKIEANAEGVRYLFGRLDGGYRLVPLIAPDHLPGHPAFFCQLGL